ncbi:hypothetical protein ABIB58_001536 [Brevundimonas sp. UYEF29]|uniref:hypothetical protein n=1 Tax=Brevundimonas TaxID=41275 RepID=UPI0033909831
MLLDQAQQLRTALDRHRELKKASGKASVFRSRAVQFGPLATDLTKAEDVRRALLAEGVEVRAPSPLPQARQQAQTLLAKFRDDRDSLSDADPAIRHAFTGALKSAIAESGKTSSEAWRAMVVAKADIAALDQVLSALENLSAYAGAVARIRQLDAILIGIRDTIPEAGAVKERLDALNAAVKARSEAIGAIEGGDVPPTVLAFLRKVAQGGAGLDDFTVDVRDWLVARNLLAGFRIVPQRSAS